MVTAKFIMLGRAFLRLVSHGNTWKNGSIVVRSCVDQLEVQARHDPLLHLPQVVTGKGESAVLDQQVHAQCISHLGWLVGLNGDKFTFTAIQMHVRQSRLRFNPSIPLV